MLSHHYILWFPVCYCWTVKKAECWRTDAFELWCWRRFLRVPWTARRSNQSILKEISLEYSLEGLMLKLRLQYFGHLTWRTHSLEKTLTLGKIEDRRRRGWQDEMVGWHHQLNGLELEQVSGVGDGQSGLACCSPWGQKEWDTTEQLNWTTIIWAPQILWSILWKVKELLYGPAISHLLIYLRTQKIHTEKNYTYSQLLLLSHISRVRVCVTP